MKRINVDVEQLKRVCEESQTMAIAAARMGFSFATFKRLAMINDCNRPNQGNKGLKKNYVSHACVPLSEILTGNHPSFQTHKLKLKLLKAGIFKNQCTICHIESWQNKKIVCELDHIDGNRTNHRLENLRMLCPNCHSQTDTFRSKKRLSE